jgi:hypothetical protein
VLIEVLGDDHKTLLTAGVESDGPGPMIVNLGGSPPLPDGRCEVVVSFFTPSALHLGRGTARALADHRLVEIDVRALQHVQRRSAPRVPCNYPVAIGAFDGVDDYISVAGETIDLAVGGCRVVVSGPLPEGGEATVCIQCQGEPVVAQARVVDLREDRGRWEYRLAFEDIDEPDRRRLLTLIAR